ncbi:hypothetical protein QE152_g14176 [Popillia japonica]|uniref:Uncharacterized protein n=1 Tax=Popillia japonica TaxID=7064 RepID=A0AAW1LA56_POPJA
MGELTLAKGVEIRDRIVFGVENTEMWKAHGPKEYRGWGWRQKSAKTKKEIEEAHGPKEYRGWGWRQKSAKTKKEIEVIDVANPDPNADVI